MIEKHIHYDIILIGAGIMSATLAVFLKELIPDIKIALYERLDEVGRESSDAWNNAGTGHSAFCELNYTPEQEDGSIDISKALKIASSFEQTKEFWSFMVEKGFLPSPSSFIHRVPHMSFVWGNDNVKFLQNRYNALIKYPLFSEMKHSENELQLKKWMPLVMDGRESIEKLAATRMEIGTDVNFGSLSRAMIAHLQKLVGFELYLQHEAKDIDRSKSGGWDIEVKNELNDTKFSVHARYVFVGAGGGSLPLLEKAHIPEAKGFGGFPVSGQWFVCNNEEIIAKHSAKVYGKASVGSPPMSVPHLDTRIIDGKKSLLFGPYAGFSTKFLKNGSYTDLPFSLELDNIIPMVSAGLHNIPLTKYLINQVLQSPEDRLKALLEYFPKAKLEDWNLAYAGQRVQVIKKDAHEGGTLEFGTEIVVTEDGTLSALLGASPGASTAVSIILDILKKCYKTEFESVDWQKKLQKMIPSLGKSFVDDADLVNSTRERTSKVLCLN